MESRVILFGFKSNIFFRRIVAISGIRGIGYLEDSNFGRLFGFLKRLRLLFVIKLCRAFLLTLRVRNFNTLNFYYLNREAEILVHLNRRKNIIITTYGTDYLVYNPAIVSIKHMVNRWVVSTTTGKETLIKLYGICDDIISVIPFGIDSIKGSRKSWWVGEQVICIGNNGSSRQNHVQILEWFRSFKEFFPKNTRIVLPMTYGLSKDYYDECKRLLEKLSISYNILTEYLSDDEMSAFHDSVDIYINNQPTDVLSGFMLSQLNRGSVVIVNSDLRYPELTDWGIHITYYGQCNELQKALQDFCFLRAKSSVNIDKLSDKFGWYTCTSSYQRLWDSI